jgi:hypothetical protein
VCQFLIEEALLYRLELDELQQERQAEQRAAAADALARSKERLSRVTGEA